MSVNTRVIISYHTVDKTVRSFPEFTVGGAMLVIVYHMIIIYCHTRATPYEMHPCISVVEKSEKVDCQG